MSESLPRYTCIHGHFYQPPRENPWLEAVEVQDSASPDHDWNARVTRECYAPNARSRLKDNQGRIVHLLNNYAWMSFNFGPTLLAWMEQERPDVLQGIVEGDRLSRERRGGHGNALAQVYNHMIMPLASEQDKRTQVLWGIADFRRHFGREPEGMWLAETAADTATLEALADAGIRFTILAPRQAKRWRRIGEENWTEIVDGIDPSRAYLCRLPSGKTINLFFYDGVISRQVAFERLLDSGEKFLGRLMQGFDDSRQHPQLMHIATDGESYGHHHAHGDMALAYVLHKLSQDPHLKLTNYGEYLELHPPEWEVEIHDHSSWSCVHGVERWRSDCGCKMRSDWQQAWRGPLRQALDGLKKRLDELFVSKGRECFPDPWAARDGYISVIHDRGPESVQRFMQQYAHPSLAEAKTRDALNLLEMQRHAMLMYTSCGWFFDEISGLETTQCLRYAARAMQLARRFQLDAEPELVQELEKAPSNLPQLKNGRVVWERIIQPSRVELERVLAHYAISLIYRQPGSNGSVYSYEVERLDEEVRGRGNTHLAVGRLRVRSRLTGDEAEASFVVVHYGGLDFHTVLLSGQPKEGYDAFKQKLLDAYANDSMADVTTLAAQQFQGQAYHLDDLFADEQRRIIGIVLQDRFDHYRQSFQQLAEGDEDILNRLGMLHYPLPKPMQVAASLSLDHRIGQELSRPEDEAYLNRVRDLYERGKVWGYQPDRESFAKVLTNRLRSMLSDVKPEADLPALTAKAGEVLDAAGLLEIALPLWEQQNQLLQVFADLKAKGAVTQPLHEEFVKLAARLNLSPELLGWRP